MEYKIVLEPDVEDGGYVVHCPALAGCYSQGDTKEEATENIRESIETYLESRGGPRFSDRLLRWSPDPTGGIWNTTKETELPG